MFRIFLAIQPTAGLAVKDKLCRIASIDERLKISNIYLYGRFSIKCQRLFLQKFQSKSTFSF